MLGVGCTQSNPWFFTVPQDGSSGGEASSGGSTAVVDAEGSSGAAETSGPALPGSAADPAMTTSEPGSSSSGEPPLTGESGETSEGADGSSESTSGETTTAGESEGGESTTDGGPCMDVCDTPNCGSCPPTNMVDVDSFKMDAFEVSNAQYQAFLAAKVAPETQKPECAGNTDFTPGVWPPADDDPQVPVVEVDWCDAYAFCAWSKKRLCGKIGGGPVAIGDLINPLKSQWYRACSGGVGNLFPYGPVYETGVCNGMDAGEGKALPVGSMPQCQGSVPGLYDLSGNVFEWVDSCEGPEPQANCLRRGGSFFSVPEAMQCNLKSVRKRDDRDSYVGFRCCGE